MSQEILKKFINTFVVYFLRSLQKHEQVAAQRSVCWKSRSTNCHTL